MCCVQYADDRPLSGYSRKKYASERGFDRVLIAKDAEVRGWMFKADHGDVLPLNERCMGDHAIIKNKNICEKSKI